ncbi:hypothetical protein ACJIZ3_014278 [Penstemon smallii]|uniref:Protein FAR1-RELATED SEQUENCE n=1 Tax=Penstemon smallii TaxID=265156 RepID=A0ABD3RJB5_9LAMI
MVDMNNENDFHDYMDTRPSENIDEIHARISKELIPKINMEFETEEAAHKFYLSYAKAVGFGVRLSKAHKDTKTCKNLDRIFCCSRQGERRPDTRDISVISHRSLTRCNCSAEMKINCRQSNTNQAGNYRIVRFIAEHNHDCVTPSKTHLIRSHRRMTISCGIAQRETMELLAKQVGGPEYLGANKMRLGDTGGDDLITNIFWADAKMRSDYSHFGDVVCFDTTYRKHKDGRPIALFVGVNNHKQTTIFGAALLYDETAVTFSWLFDTFAATMLGKKPQTILTDQDKAMSKALAARWPETYHRLCVWHINQNTAIHLSNVFSQYKDFAKEFSSCIYDYEFEDEFIDAWDNMIETYGLQNNEWLKGLFQIKEKWALVYGRETFCADMCTTQRSESMNSVIKKYISYKNELVEFFEHFERLLNDRRCKESRADFYTSQSVPSLLFPVQILKCWSQVHAAMIYTPKILELFQIEVCLSHDCDVEVCSENDTKIEFQVTYHGKHHHHYVTYDSTDASVSCSCKRFEFVGILCSHALKVLNFKKIVKIPDQYIKKRWVKTAKKQIVKVGEEDMNQIDPKDLLSYRYRELCQIHSKLVSRAAESQKAYEIAKLGLLKLLEQVEETFELQKKYQYTLMTRFTLLNLTDLGSTRNTKDKGKFKKTKISKSAKFGNS